MEHICPTPPDAHEHQKWTCDECKYTWKAQSRPEGFFWIQQPLPRVMERRRKEKKINPYNHWEVWITVRNPRDDTSYTEFMYVNPELCPIDASPGGTEASRRYAAQRRASRGYTNLNNFYQRATLLVMKAYAGLSADRRIAQLPGISPLTERHIRHKMNESLMTELQAQLDAELGKYRRRKSQELETSRTRNEKAS